VFDVAAVVAVIVPPKFALTALLARMNAALAYCPVAFCDW
jgi:hypothetical protein